MSERLKTARPFPEMAVIMGDNGPDTLVYIAREPGHTADKTCITYADAYSQFSDWLVTGIWAYVTEDGELRGNVYIIEEAPKPTSPWIVNPTKIPYDLPTWRMGDDAYLLQSDVRPPDPKKYILYGHLGAVSWQGNKVHLVTFVQSDGTMIHNVPLDALFKTMESAVACAVSRRDWPGR